VTDRELERKPAPIPQACSATDVKDSVTWLEQLEKPTIDDIPVSRAGHRGGISADRR
jgi:hypothetical protein